MQPVQTKTIGAFRSDERGAVMVTFGIMFFMLVLMCGVAIDFARIHHAYTRLATAADAAALAAGKAMLDGRNSDSAVRQIASKFFQENFNSAESYAKVLSFTPTLDRATNAVSIDVVAEVPMTIMKVAGYDSVNVPLTSAAKFDQKDIELSLALDVTGSMCTPCSKIQALKDATNDLLDIMLPDAGNTNKVRVAFAPYSSGVNAGSLAGPATRNRSANGCTFEREGAEPNGDQAPGPNNYLKVAGDAGVSGSATCPRDSRVIGLSDDKRLLKDTVRSYDTGGSTAGHLGAQWAWYLVSPQWAGILGGESAPAAYKDGKTIKAVVLMTDGANNTIGGRNYGDYSAEARQSDARVREICTSMKGSAHGIMVFTVGFQLGGNPFATSLLKDCAGTDSRFFPAENRNELRAAFAEIASQLTALRLTK